MTARKTSLRLPLVLGALLVLPASFLGQESRESPGKKQNSQSAPPGQPGPFVILRNVNRVIVDVVVTDSNGKPVHGLSRENFTIEEDKKPETILSFDVHTLESNPGFFSKLPPMPPNTFVNIATAPERGPLYILLLDLVNTEPDDQAYARGQLLKFVQGKPEGTRFAVFTLTDGLHLVQGFTSDREQLYAALDPSRPRSHVPRIFLYGRSYGRGDPLLMISVLKDIAFFADGLAGRKNLIWVAGSFPLSLFPNQITEDQPDLSQETRETLDALARSESALYPVDVRGVVAFAEGGLTGGVPNGGAQSSGSAPGAPAVNSPGGGPVMAAMSTAGRTGGSLSTSYLLQDVAAQLTGGRAFYSRNDLKDALEEATEAGADYYTLSYSPADRMYDGKVRTIRVRLSKPGYRLEYRHAYVATGPQSAIMPARYAASSLNGAPPARPVGDSLSANMQHGAPIMREVYFRAHLQALGAPQPATPDQMANLAQQPAYFRLRKKVRALKPLPPVPVQSYIVEYKIIGRFPNLEVAAGAYDDEGRLLNADVEDATSARGDSDAEAKARYFRVEQTILVPAGARSMRLAVRDISTDRIGALEIPLPLAPEPPPVSNNQASSPAESR